MIADATRALARIGHDAGADRLRFVMRFVNALLVPRMARWRTALAVDAIDAFLVQATLALALPRPAPGEPIPGLETPDAQRQPVPLAAMAQSAGLSYETARRRVARLRAAGLMQQRDDGFIVPAALPGARELVRGDRAALLAMLSAMATQGLHIADAVAAGARADPHRVARVALDFTVRSLEEVVAVDGGLVPGLIRIAIIHANTRHLLDDAAVSLRYAHEDRPLPDALRRAVGPRALAREAALPFETVRRHVAAMLDAGMLARVDGGVILTGRQLMTPPQLAHQRRVLAHFRRLVGDLASLPPGDAAGRDPE